MFTKLSNKKAIITRKIKYWDNILSNMFKEKHVTPLFNKEEYVLKQSTLCKKCHKNVKMCS